MRRHELSREEWQKLKEVLPKGIGRPPKISHRRFINAVLWKVKTGVPWRDIPSRYGKWKTIYSRLRRWAKAGHFQVIFEALQVEVDDNWNSLDGTYIRVHQHAAGGKGGASNSALEKAAGDILRKSMRALMLKEN
jgi:transposase